MSEQGVKPQLRVGDRVVVEFSDGASESDWEKSTVTDAGETSISVQGCDWWMRWDGAFYSAEYQGCTWRVHPWSDAFQRMFDGSAARDALREITISDLMDYQAIALYEYAKGLGVL